MIKKKNYDIYLLHTFLTIKQTRQYYFFIVCGMTFFYTVRKHLKYSNLFF